MSVNNLLGKLVSGRRGGGHKRDGGLVRGPDGGRGLERGWGL